MSNPLVSISVPVYNQELYLKKCVDSILAQTYDNWECVLVDDGSTDSSGIICDEYAKLDNRIKVIHKQNAGLAAARQTGLENINGKYVINIDSDDWIDCNHIENLVTEAEKEKADIVICPYYQNTESEQRFIECKPTAFDTLTLQCEALNGKYHAGIVLKLISRNLFLNNPIQPAPYSFYEDMFTYLSCLQFAKKVIYLPVATYHYRYNNVSLTNIPNINVRLRMYEQCMLNLLTLIEQFSYNRNDKIMNAIHCRVNFEKGRLLVFFIQYSKIIPYILKYFPDSVSIIEVCDLRTWATKHALTGNVFPFIIFKIVNVIKNRIKNYLKKS